MVGAINQVSGHSLYSDMAASQGGPRAQSRTEDDIQEAAAPPPAETSDSKIRKENVAGPMDTVELSKNETDELQELKARDQEVKKHENAHKAAAGRYASGGMSFEYQSGPDGKRYAVGGEVSIDLTPGKTPEETIKKAGAIRTAALAPAEPSGQDRKVAAMASRMEQEARQELALKLEEKVDEANPAPSAPSGPTSQTAAQDEPVQQLQPRDTFPKGTEGLSTAPLPSIGDSLRPNEMPKPQVSIDLARADIVNPFEQIKANSATAAKTYQENTPSSLSPVDTSTAGMVTLSMAI